MEIIEGKLYFIKDKFIEKYNPKYHLMENKETGTKRPTYFCFRDKLDYKVPYTKLFIHKLLETSTMPKEDSLEIKQYFLRENPDMLAEIKCELIE